LRVTISGFSRVGATPEPKTKPGKKEKRKGKEGKKEKRQKRQKTTPLFFRLFPDCVLCFDTELKDPQTWEGVDMTFASHHKRILASWGNPGAENETGKKRKKGKKEKGEKKEKKEKGEKKEKRKKGKKNKPLDFSPFFPIVISPECGRLSVVNNTQSRVILAARF